MKIILFFITTAVTLGAVKFSNAQTLPSYLPANGLVGWWPFNGNANDESGNGNHGLVNGAIPTSDRLGNSDMAYDFDSDYILVEGLNLDLATNYSISFWIKPITNVDGYTVAFEINQGTACNFNPVCGFFSNNLVYSTCGNSNQILDMGSFSSLQNLWTHFVVTCSGSNSIVYKNSAFFASNSISWPQININRLTIGNIGNSASPLFGQPFKGVIDEFGLWNRALTQEEITALYTATPTNGGGGNNTVSGNVPQAISYQAVARNAQGQPLSNTALQVKFTLLADSLTGATEYTELHSLTTNELGLFTTAFGTGSTLLGTFANINWAGGNKFVKIEADQGSGFIEMGTQQMLSVPYSMRSQTSAAIQNNALPVYANNAAALAGGLQAGQMYRTATGDLKIVY